MRRNRLFTGVNCSDMTRLNRSWLIAFKLVFASSAIFFSSSVFSQLTLKTSYFSIGLNKNGYITSMKNISVSPNREFSPVDKPSPLLCLYDSKKNKYYFPTHALYSASSVQLNYDNGSVATINFSTVNNKYFKFALQDVVPRNGIDVVQWGPYHTNITNLFGEVIGVARDTSQAVNFAIGALALNDTTIGGAANNQGDVSPFQYIIHSPDTARYPLPYTLHEGEVFPIGGNGISDVAFYSHPEEYYRILYGDAAIIDSAGRVSVQYHARDRRQKRLISFSMIPQLASNAPIHLEVQPVPGVDLKGSAIAFYGCPDSIALPDVIKNIVLTEGLPYPAYAINGSTSEVWVKDPARYTPDVITDGGLFDSTISYVRQMGFKAIQAEEPGFFSVNRGNEGYIDGDPVTSRPFHFTPGDKSHKEFTDLSNPFGILMGRHTITTALPQGTKDVSPTPSDSLCVALRRILKRNVNPTDSNITVDDPEYLDEVGSWEGHEPSLNMIKIGKELIHYNGMTKSPPYTLQNVTRGYWGTRATAHKAGDTIYKMTPTLGFGYEGLIPDIHLQDAIAEYYGDVSIINGMYYIDWDGQEFLFDQGMGYYSVKRFHRKLFERVEGRIPYLRIMGATLSEGSWHYQSVWNVGSGTNMYDIVKRTWGTEGKDIRNVAFANYFPATFGANAGINATSTVQQYENLEAISVGVGVTYMMTLNQSSIEQCPQKYAIFSAIKTWENARAANAFPGMLKRELADPDKYFHLEQVNNNTWNLYKTNSSGGNPVFYRTLTRAVGY
jgi:hypothetical protein